MIRPIRDLILVKPDDTEEVTKSGIYIPHDARTIQQWGKVLDVGSDVTHVKKGNRVYFGKYSGAEIKVNDVKYLVFKEEDVLGVE